MTANESLSTPPPWGNGTHPTDYDEPGVVHYVLSKPDYERACKCVNAMAGISDPVTYLADMEGTIEFLKGEVARCRKWLKGESDAK